LGGEITYHILRQDATSSLRDDHNIGCELGQRPHFGIVTELDQQPWTNFDGSSAKA